MNTSYYLIKAILRLKGTKRLFSKNPIPVNELRREDKLQPPNKLARLFNLRTFFISDSKITELESKNSSQSQRLIIYLPGGAFISGPNKYAWEFIHNIGAKTKWTSWLVNYPKAPEYQIDTITKNIYAVYLKALEKYPSEKIVLVGDSAGGNLVLSLVQKLIQEKEAVPFKTILITPVVECSLDHPEIKSIDPLDPMLSASGVRSAKQMCAGELSLKKPLLSPKYGDFKNYPETLLFIAEYDILTPDTQELEEIMKNQGVKIHTHFGKNMPHIWPLLPVIPEGKRTRKKIIDFILN